MKTPPILKLGSLLLAGLLSSAAAGATVAMPAEVLRDKIRGGLLGQILGNLNGLPHEMKYLAEPGKVTGYVPGLPQGDRTPDDAIATLATRDARIGVARTRTSSRPLGSAACRRDCCSFRPATFPTTSSGRSATRSSPR